MPIRTRDLIPVLLTLVILLSVSSVATQLPKDNQGNSNQNRNSANFNRIDRPDRDTIEKVLEGMKEESATNQLTEQAGKRQIRSTVQSGFENSVRETFGPDKVVMTCDAIEQLQAFAGQALDKSTNTGFEVMARGDRAAAEQVVATAQDQFKKFLQEQIKRGEQLKDGHVLITGKSFNETRMRICPLIPIC